MRLKKKMAAVFIGVASMFGGMIAAAGTASASGTGYVYEETAYYRCPWNSCLSGYTSTSATLVFDCWQDSPYSPFNRFFYILGGGEWFRAETVYNQPSLPRCNHY